MRRVVLCVLVAGCGGGTGTALEITAPRSTETVELFIGNTLVYKDAANPRDDFNPMCPLEAPDMCSVRPPDPYLPPERGAFASGHGWTSNALKATRNTATDGVFGFSLEPDSETYIGALLLVGFDGQDIPTGYALLHDLTVDGSPEVFQIELAPAQYIAPPTSAVDRIQVWRRPDDYKKERSACAMVEKTDHAIEWFVPNDDTDCDGALPEDPVTPECPYSEWQSCGRYPGSLDQAECTVMVPGGGGSGTTSCRWAGPECADRSSLCDTSMAALMPNNCVPTEQIACFPPQVCNYTTSSTCSTFNNADPAMCVPKAVTDTAFADQAPYLSCTFNMETISKPCGGIWPPIPAQLNTQVLTQNTACQRMELAQFGTPMELGTKVRFNNSNDVELKSSTSCTTGEMQVTFNVAPSTNDFAGGALVGLVTTDYKRRYYKLALSFMVFGANGCTAAQVSHCDWKGPQTYVYPCN